MNLQVLKGSLLGDAWIQKFPNRPNSYGINFQQSEYNYTKWKAEMCGIPYTLSKYKRFDKRTKKIYYSYSVYLRLNKKYKRKLYESFYTPKKEVSVEILDSLSPLAIAIWYMDDGNLYYNGNNCHLSLAIDGFNAKSKDNIIAYFKNNYSINFKKSKESIRITSVRETKLFMNIVEKYIPKCMARKTLKFQKNKYDKTLTNEQRKFRNKKYR